jgi:hypothetical protein
MEQTKWICTHGHARVIVKNPNATCEEYTAKVDLPWGRRSNGRMVLTNGEEVVMSNTSPKPDTSLNREVLQEDEDEEVEQEEEPEYVGYSCWHCGGGHLGRNCTASVREMNAYQKKMLR